MGLFMCMKQMGDEDVDLIIRAFEKVWYHLDALT